MKVSIVPVLFLSIGILFPASVAPDEYPAVCRITGGDGDIENARLRKLLTLIETSSPEVLGWRKTIQGEEYRHRAVLADKYPRLSFGSTPSSGPGYTASNDKDGENEGRTIHSADAGIFLAQELPTAGALTLGAYNTISVTVPESGDNIYRQNPGIKFNYSQPFLANGKFIDPDLYSSKYNVSASRLSAARNAARRGMNAVVINVMSLLLTIETIGHEIAYGEHHLNVLEEEIRIAKLSLQQGKGTPSDIWEKELERGTRQEQVLSLSYALRENYYQLGGALQISDDDIDDLLPLIDLLPAFSFQAEDIKKTALLNNPDIKEKEIDKSTAEYNRVLAGGTYAPDLSLNFGLSPRYPKDLAPANSLADSFSDFSEEGGWMKLSGGISFNVPVYTGSKRKYHSLSRDKELEKAVLDLNEEKRALFSDIDLLLLQRELLRKRYELYSESLSFAENKFTEARKMLAAKRTTPLEVERAELQVLHWKSQLYQNRKDLFLNGISLLEISGVNIAETLTR